MSVFPALIFLSIPFIIYIIPMLIGSAILLSLFKVRVNRYIIISGCLPFLTCCGLFGAASLSNMVVNPFILSFCMLFVHLIYHIVNKFVTLKDNTINYAFLGFSIVTVVAFTLFMPALPE